MVCDVANALSDSGLVRFCQEDCGIVDFKIYPGLGAFLLRWTHINRESPETVPDRPLTGPGPDAGLIALIGPVASPGLVEI